MRVSVVKTTQFSLPVGSNTINPEYVVVVRADGDDDSIVRGMPIPFGVEGTK
jgi:hypothetical protein